MGNEKINQPDWVNLLAEHAAFSSKSEANRFLSALQAAFQETLLNERVLKLNSVGTFRLQWVEARKSVDVRTGETIEIAGHDKLSFTADVALKELVCATPSDVATKITPLQNLSAQAIEIKGILSEINVDDTQVQEIENQPIEIEEKPIVAEPEENISREETKVEENQPENQSIPTPTDETKEILKTIVDNAIETPQKPKRKCRAWIWIVLALLLLGASGYAAYYFYGDIIRTWVEGKVTYFLPADEAEVSEDLEKNAKIATEEETEVVAQDVNFDDLRVYNEWLGTERITQGVHLAILADKYYGHKDFWIYIYEANRDFLKNPDNVSVGMEIKLPKLDERLVDAENPAAVEYAQTLGQSYLK